MKSKFFFSMLLVLLAVSLGGMTSCKDDDDDKEETHGEESEVSDEQADKATKFWDVVSQLTSLDNYTADYEGKTFAPTIGEASKSNFFGDEGPRYIIRHATGADLVADGANWDVKQPISGVTPVYIYNYEYYPVGTPGGTADHFRDLTIAEPEVTVHRLRHGGY